MTPTRMAPNAAVCFMLVGAALFLRRLTRPARAWALTILLGYAAAGHWRRRVHRLSRGSGAGLSMGTAVEHGGPHRGLLHPASAPASLASAGKTRRPRSEAPGFVRCWSASASMAVTVVVWQGLVSTHREQARYLTLTEARHLRTAITAPAEMQIRVLEEMARRWSVQVPAYEQWIVGGVGLSAEHRGPPGVRDRRRRRTCHVDRSARASAGGGARRRRARRARSQARGTDTIDGAVAAGRQRQRAEHLRRRPGLPRRRVLRRCRRRVPPDRPVDERARPGRGERLSRGALRRHDARVRASRRRATSRRTGATSLGLRVREATWRLGVWPTGSRVDQLEGPLPSVLLAGGILLSALAPRRSCSWSACGGGANVS